MIMKKEEHFFFCFSIFKLYDKYMHFSFQVYCEFFFLNSYKNVCILDFIFSFYFFEKINKVLLLSFLNIA